MYIGILACGDIPHILLTILSFPSEIAANPLSWNATAYGNIVGTACLFALRMAWFAGIGRQAAAPLTKDK
ncbi:hypothetical protein BDV93DRAFT_521906 [Ceratobasidium sp. AG-I]|nr:hypothetical protein BDV93DRAFT_521906 [Ceratobasidium sp. AG-I]